MQKIGERTEFYRKGDNLFLIIKSTIETWKKIVLVLWWVAWLICGVLIIKEIGNIQNREIKMFLYAFLSFWVYYLYRIGKVVLWRFYGREFIKLDPEKFTLKRAILSYGKAQSYFIENISDLEVIKVPPTAFFSFMENSFWSLGAETIQFKHLGKPVRFGIQLAANESKQIRDLFILEFRKRKKALKHN